MTRLIALCYHHPMGYFFTQQDDIPYGMGYELFGPAHLFSMAVTLTCVILLIIFFIRSGADKRKKILIAIPVLMLILEIIKDLILAMNHRFGIGYLPLHMCSFGMLIFLLQRFLKNEKAKAYFGEVAFILILPAGLFGLIFADWTIYYPVLNFFNIHGYIWHGLLIAYPILIIINRDVAPDIKHIHYVLSFILIVTVPVFIFDKIFNCNYLFINRPVPDSPLSLMASYMGNPGYLAGYLFMLISVILFMYLISSIWSRAQKRLG
ncbi:MAG TPA: hypothetical protein DCG85_08055 [Lachnospiraceae bacterium]|nr:hypothetical protein [Lachnospiraceae bacterium]